MSSSQKKVTSVVKDDETGDEIDPNKSGSRSSTPQLADANVPAPSISNTSKSLVPLQASTQRYVDDEDVEMTEAEKNKR